MNVAPVTREISNSNKSHLSPEHTFAHNRIRIEYLVLG